MSDPTPPSPTPRPQTPEATAASPPTTPAVPPDDSRPDDHALEVMLAGILGVGVKLSMSLCGVGIVMHLVAIARSGGSTGDPTLGRRVIFAGIVLLIATPVLRVIASAAAFAVRREWVFAILSLAVLAVLLLSFLLGGVAG